MNFADLKTEFFARGTDYLSEDAAGVARAERWLNQAYREIINLHAWPFLQTTVTGTAGAGLVEIADLRKILLVTDASTGGNMGRPLQRVSVEDLVDDGEDLNSTGSPNYYWVDGGRTVKGFPLGGTISVRYVRRINPLSGTDEPIFDEEYHDLIVDRAMMKAYKDSDNFEAAAALREEFNLGVSAMAEDYLLDSRHVQFIEPTGFDV